MAGGISKPRVLSCGDSAGERILKPLLDSAISNDIRITEEAAVRQISIFETPRYGRIFELTLDNNSTGDVSKVFSRFVIIATGGLLPREKRAGLTAHASSVPDGVELAQQLGAEVRSADLVQLHPTGVITPSVLRRERLPETMRGHSAKILNNRMEEFVDSLAPRQLLSNSIVEALSLIHI